MAGPGQQTNSNDVLVKLEQKTESQKGAIKTMVLALLTDGERDGMRSDSVKALREGLQVLGWLPVDLKR